MSGNPLNFIPLHLSQYKSEHKKIKYKDFMKRLLLAFLARIYSCEMLINLGEFNKSVLLTGELFVRPKLGFHRKLSGKLEKHRLTPPRKGVVKLATFK